MSILIMSASTSLTQLKAPWCSDMATSFEPPARPVMQATAYLVADAGFEPVTVSPKA